MRWQEITELFDKPADFELQEVEEGLYRYRSNIDGNRLSVVILYKSGAWDVTFMVNKRMDIVNSNGNEVVIFSTVIAILKDFIQRENPEFIEFSATKNEASRISLYDKMVDRLAKSHGYKLRKGDNITGIDYELQKKTTKTSKQDITELFDKPKPFNKQKKGKDYVYHADVGGDTLKFISILSNEEWHVMFSVNGHTDMSDSSSKEISIFSTVLAMLRDFVEIQQPDPIKIIAKTSEQSRIKLYNRLIKKFSASSGYKLADIETGSDTIYTLKLQKEQ